MVLLSDRIKFGGPVPLNFYISPPPWICRNFAIAMQAVGRMHLLFKVKGLLYNVDISNRLQSESADRTGYYFAQFFLPQFLKEEKRKIIVTTVYL
jgi:hypothetical protein